MCVDVDIPEIYAEWCFYSYLSSCQYYSRIFQIPCRIFHAVGADKRDLRDVAVSKVVDGKKAILKLP